jgi:hypothetical protein
MRSGYRELGLEIVFLEETYSRQPKKPPMEEGKRDDKEGHHFKTFLEEDLVRQRNEMMDNFTQILRILPMVEAEESLTSIHFASVTPFKVQVNFYIPFFEGKIDVVSLEKWLNTLEGYYSIQTNFDSENITHSLLKSLPHVREWWKGYSERYTTNESTPFKRETTWEVFEYALKEEF